MEKENFQSAAIVYDSGNNAYTYPIFSVLEQKLKTAGIKRFGGQMNLWKSQKESLTKDMNV